MKKLDKSTNDKVWAFIEKLSADHTAPGLHIEPIKGSVDPRVRTGRVDLNFRAILFKIDAKLGEDPTFIYMGTWPHDDAIMLAERSKLRVNPINGVLEGIDDAHVPSAATMRSVPEEEQPEALLRERSLLYVAASRARDALVVTWIGKKSALLGSATE